MTDFNLTNYEPYHGIHDQDKFESLVQDMLINGWQGQPLVADDGYLITGSHRYAAVKYIQDLFEDGKTDEVVRLEVIDIRDIYPDFDDHMGSWDYPTIGERMYAQAIDCLPEALKDEYGIDIH